MNNIVYNILKQIQNTTTKLIVRAELKKGFYFSLDYVSFNS